jgi:hypothetical protein
MGASIEKPCLQISARRNGTLDPSLTKHSKTKKYQTRSVRPLQPSGRVRVEVNVFHITAAMQLRRIIIFALERFGKCMLGFIRIDSMVETFQDRGASLGYSEIPHVNMCLARPKFRDAVNLHVPQRKTAS